MKTRPTGALIASAVIISLLGLSFATSAGAETQFESSIVLSHGVFYFNYQEGGPGIGNAQESVSTGWVPTWGGYYDQSADVAAEASASSGILRASARGSVRLNPICDPCSAGTAFATANATALDSFQIQAGNGYANDDIVQVRVLAGLSGSVFLQGTPSGGNDWTFRVSFGYYPGSSELFNLDLYSGGLLPPYQATVGPTQWDQVVDVQVGRTYYLYRVPQSRRGQVRASTASHPAFTRTSWISTTPGRSGSATRRASKISSSSPPRARPSRLRPGSASR